MATSNSADFLGGRNVLQQKIQFNIKAGEIHMGVGAPGDDLLQHSVAAAAKGAAHRLAQPDACCLFQYGPEQGECEFLKALSGFLSTRYDDTVVPNHLMVTPGASEGLSMACALLVNPGDHVFVEDPTYFLANQVFEDHGLKVVPIPTDAEGMLTSALNDAATSHRSPHHEDVPADKVPKRFNGMVYLVPTFNNPTGRIMSDARRREVVRLAYKHGLVVVCDDVYELLSYPPSGGKVDVPKRLVAYDTGAGRVIGNCSMSKIFGPGIRLGWFEAQPMLVSPLADCGKLASGGALNQFTSGIMTSVISLGLLDSIVDTLRKTYGARLAALTAALTRELPEAQFTAPLGGYFLWVRLPEGVDTEKLLLHCRDAHAVAFQPGNRFSATKSFGNYLRLSFAHYNEAQLTEGIARLARGYRSMAK